MKFSCLTCNYETDVKFCYQKHLKTKKHKQKAKQDLNASQTLPKNLSNNSQKIKCQFCDLYVSKSSNLARHLRICYAKKELENKYKDEIKDLNDRIGKLEERIDHLNELSQKDQETIKNLAADNKYLKIIVRNAGSIIKTSVSAMSYVMKNYQNAPIFETITDTLLIQQEVDDEKFAKALINYHEVLDQYLGDIIIKLYKKDNPTQQSLWNTDTSRFTYMIKEITKWSVDKNGKETIKYVIDPMLSHVLTLLHSYLENSKILFMKGEKKEIEFNKDSLIIGIIQKKIQEKILARDILKYISPHFYLNKIDDSLLE